MSEPKIRIKNDETIKIPETSSDVICLRCDYKNKKNSFNKEKKNEESKDLIDDYQKKFLLSTEKQKSDHIFDKYYCYPKFMVKLKSGFHNTKKIIDYAENCLRLFHIDLRYGEEEKHLKTFDAIKTASEFFDKELDVDCQIGTAIEISNRSLRTGLLRHAVDCVLLDRDTNFILTADRSFSTKGSVNIVYVNFFDFVNLLNVNDRIKIGTGIHLKVEKVFKQSVLTVVMREGLLQPKQEVLLPTHVFIDRNIVTKEEEDDIAFALDSRPDFLICPCLDSPQLYNNIRWSIVTRQLFTSIIGKISVKENMTEQFIDNMMKESAGLWIVPGTESGCDIMEEKIIEKCLNLGKFILRNGDRLKEAHVKFRRHESVKNNFLYPDCLILSETLEPNDVEAIRQNLCANYPDMNLDTMKYACGKKPPENISIVYMFARRLMIESLIRKASCIILITNTLATTSALSRFRPVVPIIASLLDNDSGREYLIHKNVIPLIYQQTSLFSWKDELNARIMYSMNYARRIKVIAPDEPFMLCFDSRRGCGISDTYRLCFMDDEQFQ